MASVPTTFWFILTNSYFSFLQIIMDNYILYSSIRFQFRHIKETGNLTIKIKTFRGISIVSYNPYFEAILVAGWVLFSKMTEASLWTNIEGRKINRFLRICYNDNCRFNSIAI